MSRVQTLYELQMIGTAVFAVTGVLAVNRRGLDAFGGIVLGTVTSLGGGTIRDVVIRAPVFWLIDTNYLLVAVVASLVLYQPVVQDHLHSPPLSRCARRRDVRHPGDR